MTENRVEVLGDETDWNKSWDQDESLRAEFLDDKNRWLSYCRANANGQIKLFKR